MLGKYKFSNYQYLIIIFIIGAWTIKSQSSKLIFESISPKRSGITFINKLVENEKNNILKYEYFYNGGGVAIGDINNDGYDDVFFTGNLVENKLYLNQKDFNFKDITKSSGVAGKKSWTTGVTMADINGDGLLDIYVCYSGNGNLESRRNELYINQGDLTFIESAKTFGLDDPSNSTQALFFDFDNDGDLDMYLLNHHIEVINEIEFESSKKVRHPFAGDKLYRNENGKFIDISEKAGIKGYALGFGLGVIASDINNDGFLDIYVTNDYIEPDYLYINNGDGTFSDKLTETLQHISHFSMGVDIADINNNGLVDIYTLDMLPEDNKRQKLLYGPENYEQYALMLKKGFYRQNMRNMLQLNQGNGLFSEIGYLAGISSTDWSWSALFFDATNNGFKDLLVTNGYFRDYTNRDFLKYKGDYYFKAAVAGEKADTLKLVTSMSSTPIPNYIFENTGHLKFINQSSTWGLSTPTFSNGAAYADLDNDGQLDLIINNINSPAGIYKNNHNEVEKKAYNYLKIKLQGNQLNSSGIGAKIKIYHKDQYQYYEQMPTRGYQSSVSHTIHLGLGNHSKVDSLIIIWPGGSKQVIYDITSNQTINVAQKDENSKQENQLSPTPIFYKSNNNISFTPKEYGFNDFKRQPLLLEMPSYLGPKMTVGSIDQQKTSLYIGGSKGTAGKIFDFTDGVWKESQKFISEKYYTDSDAVFFDVNNDGHNDLMVASGGYHDYLSTDDQLQDRLYINDGKGNLNHQHNLLPEILTSTSVIVPIDINKDGLMDIFLGSRLLPGKHPLTPPSHVLINTGEGQFVNKTNEYLPDEGKIGLVTDAKSIDINNDGWDDLIIVGEYMPIEIYINQNGEKFNKETLKWLRKEVKGWWTKINIGDFNNDGKKDFIVGNYGENFPYAVSEKTPLILYYDDFDNNGSIDPILSYEQNGKRYPYASRDELLDQMYGMRSKFTNYENYSNATLNEVLDKTQINNANKLEINELRSMILISNSDYFEIEPMPIEAQFSPIHAIYSFDYDNDGNLDLILAGNQTYNRLRLGMVDSNFGQLFKGKGDGTFEFIPQNKSGFNIKGDVKSIIQFNKDQFIFSINNNTPEIYRLNVKK
jgi:enediyne biosynthesis protein E4